MKFNSFHWNNFLESSAGRASVAFFDGLNERYAGHDPELRQFLQRWSDAGLGGDLREPDQLIAGVLDALAILTEADRLELLPTDALNSIAAARRLFEAISGLAVGEDGSTAVEPLFAVGDIPALSAALYCLHPDYFFPYYFFPRFHCLTAICNEFGIYLPPVPAKRALDERFMYYGELCASMLDFAAQHSMDPRMIPSFLYDYAPNVLQLDDNEIPPELPVARRAWFVGGGIHANGDFEYLDRIDASAKTFWQGNKDTLPGDIVVMYCLAPRSSVHSVWRALRNGTTEPFRHFYNTIWIGAPQVVPPLTLKELRDDPVLSEMPLVRQNMQGINGRRIEKRYFDRLVTLWTDRGIDRKLLPLLEGIDLDLEELKTERDVERQILEPLLHELGFEVSDWQRQVKVRFGRTDRGIPDYVVFPRVNNGRATASWVWEAKYSIDNHRQLERDFEQAVSYARVLGANGACLLSREGLWVGLKEHDYSLKRGGHWPRARLEHPDGISELRSMLGRRALLKR